MITKEYRFTKDQYTITDLAKFRLCPNMYAYSVIGDEHQPVTDEQKQFMIEAQIFAKAFNAFAEDAILGNKVYFKMTSRCLWDLMDFINQYIREYFLSNPPEDRKMPVRVAENLFKKAEDITDVISRTVRGARYRFVRGKKEVFTVDGCQFIHYSPYMFEDIKRATTRSMLVYEYIDFPVFSAGDSKGIPQHYNDIIKELKDNDTSADRVGMAIKIIRKINTQIESGYYTEDGLERISQTCREIADYDFSNPEKKKSGFCAYCKYRENCF
ncbi:MAG: hypothetical protein E7416_00960 [Ruminococcaceae bacterium]|nr:hypothetical protein [Oscillospiraceae bacterium]